ncbi:flagellar hook-length control protein FliK [Pseudomonas cavernae]|uniref:Flagellar hook-length control protein FliK n=1 Tax=Pseudomonas cavernae TaxID=2320867 RepID=A0A385Z346_9PSED|nr:flagellar hook-length control protein FliK [Pseudomonas cavernae]AYC32557.1 flagellar hook-length control protein FliK [Pseudomonas cavernae]
MSEISSTRPLPASPPPTRPSQVAEQALKLLQPLDGLLASGESAKAEVIAVKEAVAQSFQVLLKLTLANGSQATLQASSSQPLSQGSVLNVTALSDTRLAMILQSAGERALTQLDLNLLPIGTLIQGKVEASEQIAQLKAQQVLYRVVVNLLNTPLAGNKLSIETPLALPLGSLLTAQVRGSQALSFLPLSGRLDQLELGQQLLAQQNRQGSLDGLFKALQGLSGAALPAGLRASIDQLLAASPDIRQLSDAKGLAQALENSGLQLEAKLLGGNTASLPQDLKANLLRLIAQLLPQLPNAAPLNPGTAAGTLAQALPAFVRSALGALDQAGNRQQALSFPLPSKLLQAMDGEADLEALLKLAAAAVSRLQTHQLSSLAQTQLSPEGNLLTTWQLELPMRNQQELVPLQLKLQREDQSKQGRKDQQDTLWRVELAFDLAPLGPLQVQAQLAHGSLSSQMWAERPGTARLIDSELDNLRERLLAAGLTVGELACRQGTPPQGPRTTLEQRWIDETA